jgi:hypothetical protein
MPADPAMEDSELQGRLAWVAKARGLHRNKRLIAMAGIVLSACIVVWWRYDASVPEWLFWGGIALLVASWALMIYVIGARWIWVKNNPYRPGS